MLVAALRRRLGIAAGRPVVAFIGRLSDEKRPGWAVSLGTDLPGVTVVLAGDGPDRDEVEIAAALGCGEPTARVHYHRACRNLKKSLTEGEDPVFGGSAGGMTS